MAINTSLLVSAAMLQDYLVDKSTGLPLANGIVTLYEDQSRTTLKNWYYLTGSPGAYTYTQLPNPMQLSAVGTINDGNGNDVIPFFYPFSELDNTTPEFYYITVDNCQGQRQFTRQHFPFGAFSGSTPIVETGLTLRNYITNNVFWRNQGTVNASTLTMNPFSGLFSVALAPSNHDGFSMPDWEFIKSANDGTDTLTFTKFNAGQFLNTSSVNPQNEDVTPEFYLNYTCSGAGTSTSKYVQVPISLHIKTLETTPAVLTLWTRLNSDGGTGGNLLTVSILQFAGTGAASPIPLPIETITMPINSNFTKNIIPFNFPSATGVALGNGGDDALYLQIGYPAGQTFSIDIAKAQLYIGNEIPSNDCDVYDQVDEIISSVRTGDIRTSLNSFYPFGWVPMSDGTLGSATSMATTRANQDTWPLFSLLWQSFSAFTNGTTNPICQMYTSAGAAVAYGASAIADFSANNQLSLTKMMGKVLIGSVPLAALLPSTPLIGGYTSTFTATSGSGGALLVTTTTANLINLYVGAVVTFAIGTAGTLPGNITANTLYYAIPQSTTTFFIATSFTNAISGNTGAYVPFTTAGTPPNNVYAFLTGSFEGEYAHTQLIAELASHNHAPFNTPQAFVTSVGVTANLAGTNPGFGTANTTNTIGSSVPFNVVQPSTYMNFYIKL
jgi:hypothetical protein